MFSYFPMFFFFWQGTYSTQIFSLAVLLSSMFIYNQVGTSYAQVLIIVDKDWLWDLVDSFFLLKFDLFCVFPSQSACIVYHAHKFCCMGSWFFCLFKFFLPFRWVVLTKPHLTASLLSPKWLSIYVLELLGGGLHLLSLGSSLRSLFGF